MTTISYTEARDRLASVWDETVSTREPVTIDRRGHESVVLVAAGEWQGLMETAHLLRSPANARRLLGALNRLEQGEGEQIHAADLAAKVAKKLTPTKG
jgi:antitoxin YefM